jgi:two-component system OmpR family sensor kinase
VIAARVSGISLRARILFIAIILLAVGLTVGGLVVTGLLRGYLVSRVDDQLRPILKVASGQAPGLEAPRPRKVYVAGGFGGNYVAYLNSDGTLIGEADPAERLEKLGPKLPRLDIEAVLTYGGRPFDVVSEDGTGDWRVLAVPLAPEKPAVGGVVVVAAPLDEVDATIHRLQVISLITGGCLLTVLTVLGSFAISAGLRPLHRIEQTLAEVRDGDLSQRVPRLAGPRTEIGRFSAALNSMLSQNEAAFADKAFSEARMRRFVADASHELRTPLVGIKGFSKLYRMGGLPDRTDIDRTMDRIEKESERLTRLVEDLLLLARLDEHHDEALALRPAPMDLRTLAADARHDIRALDAARPVELTGPDGGPPAAAPTVADEGRMRQVVTNLVGNAVAHTPVGTRIRIGVGTDNGHAILEVADRGPGLTSHQAQRVFDRFYRADSSRSRTEGGGAGLGLAIARSLVSAHGGELTVHSVPGEGTTFRVWLPLAEAPLPDAAERKPRRSESSL